MRPIKLGHAPDVLGRKTRYTGKRGLKVAGHLRNHRLTPTQGLLLLDNAATDGFFLRLHQVSKVTCPFILIECKNYSSDLGNPELDQMAGRFGPNRGEFGLMLCRTIQDHELFLQRCRDTFRDNRGLILPLTDDDLLEALRKRAEGAAMPLEDQLSDLYRAVALA